MPYDDLLASTDALQTILDMIPCPVFMKDADLRMVFMNQIMIEWSGWSQEKMIGSTEFDRINAEQQAIHHYWDECVLATGETVEYEQYIFTETGERRVATVRKARLMLGPNKDKPYLLGTLADITEFRRAVEKSEHLSRHDTLTGLANRMYFHQTLSEAMADEAMLGHIAVLLIDLDGFKAVNDEHGHGVGDRLLCRVAHRLKKTIRAGDMLGRLGGDEFAILLRGEGDLAPAARRVADAACRIVKGPVRIDDLRTHISASVGVAHFSRPGMTPDELLLQADAAMYSVKRGGRNGVAEFSQEIERATPA